MNNTENEWILNKFFDNQLLSNFTSPTFGVGVGNRKIDRDRDSVPPSQYRRSKIMIELIQ